MGTHALSEARRAFDEIVAAVRALPSPDCLKVSGFLVASDVWDALVTRIPIARGGSFSVGDRLHVKRSSVLPSGMIVPVDAKGMPLDKPATLRVTEDGGRDA